MGQYFIRFGALRNLGVFCAEDINVSTGTPVIVRTSRGLEAGVVLNAATEELIAQLESGFEDNRIIRQMTREDIAEYRKIKTEEKSLFLRCQSIIRRMGIVMDLVQVEHLFGGERLIVYYVAEGRVDFRELVKVLAAEFQTRIEMKQIGVRDESKLLADYGDCGREVCCNSYLVEMPPVSMKMAKMQKATLDPTKISGRCGRLKCCLRYEYDVYSELQQKMPGIGLRVNTPDGVGKVLSHEILEQRIWVELSDQTRKPFLPCTVQLLPGQEKVLEDDLDTSEYPPNRQTGNK